MSELLTEMVKVGILLIEVLVVFYLVKKNEPYIVEMLVKLNERLVRRGTTSEREVVRFMTRHEVNKGTGGLTASDIVRISYETAEEKGWHSLGKSPAEEIALMHSELSEALEEIRSGRAINENWCGEDGKPEGVPSELADVVIRIGDFCGIYNIDLNQAISEKLEYNKTRPHLHGGKSL